MRALAQLGVGAGGADGAFCAPCGLLFRFFVRHVMADDAAANRAHDAVMAGVVAGDAAHNRAFQAALGLSGRRANG